MLSFALARARKVTARPADMYKSYNRVKASTKPSKTVEDPFAAPSAAAPVASTSRKPAHPPAMMSNDAFTTPKKPKLNGAMDVDEDEKPKANGVTYEHANSPARLRELITKATFSPQRSSANPLSPLKRSLLDKQCQDSPRTKARKWLGGSLGQTPKRSRSHTQSGESREVSMEPAMQETMEVSPVKPGANGRDFQPLFDDAPAAPSLVQSKLVFGKRTAADRTSAPPTMAPAPAPIRKPVKRPSESKSNGLAVRPPKRAKSAEPPPPAEAAMQPPPVASTSAPIVPKMFDADEEDEPPSLTLPKRRRRHRSPREQMDEDGEADGEGSDSSSIEERPTFRARFPETAEETKEDSPPEIIDPHFDDHADLVSALSLRASPNRKHRQAVAARKARLFAEVLHEPSAKAEARLGRAAGLEELAGLNEEGVGGSDEEGAEEGDDDDWASEPEGWKELGGVEMDGLGEELE